MSTPLKSLRDLARWHVSAQQVARRNALVASTALAERRRERVEVEDFLSSLHGSGDPPAPRVPRQRGSGPVTGARDTG